MLSSSRAKQFGGSRLPFETVRQKGGTGVASATASTRSARHASCSSGTIPLQISTAEFTNPTRSTTRATAGTNERLSRFPTSEQDEPSRPPRSAIALAELASVGYSDVRHLPDIVEVGLDALHQYA
jgi:hypothetical protein